MRASISLRIQFDPRIRIPTPLIVLGVLVAASCTERADPRLGAWEGTVDTLAGGTVVVTNAGSGAWTTGQAWSLREDLRIGSVSGDGPAGFGRIASVAVDAAERIHVLDNQAREVRTFDRDGHHVRTVGRSGQGPGEFGNPWGMAASPDASLWVMDPGNARYTAFDSAGAMISEQRRPVAFFSIPWPGGVDAEGRIYDVAVASERGFGSGAARQVLVQVTPEIGVTDTVWLPALESDPITVTRADGTPIMGLQDPFSASLVWQFDPRGFVWSAITAEYRVVQQTLAGDTVRIVRRNVPSLPISTQARDSALAAIREMIASAGAGATASREPRVPRNAPALRSLHVDVEGFVWVEPEVGPGDARRLDVFDPEGRYLGAVELDPSFQTRNPRPVFGRSHIYGVSTDDLGVPYIVRLRIEGRP